MSKIQTVKGTREFYPETMALRNYLFEKVRAASQAFGYQEYDGPFIETIDLYAAKSGEELIKKQSFVFEDRGGDVVTLRPELTPSLARMIAAKQNELTYPVRWWSFGPFWRYEQPQKGRSREFFQWNIDLLGVNSPEADAELIAVAATFMRSVGLSPERALIYMNNRRLMEAQFDALGIAVEKRLDVSNLVDRRSKMEPAKWDAYALELGLTQVQLDGLKNILGNYDLWKQSDELTRTFAALEALGVRDYVKFDPNIMRGLLYYTGTVFEAFDTSGSLKRSILGGGRYDNLLADVGGQPLPGVGFAMGDMVIGILLQEAGLLPTFQSTPAPVLVTMFDEKLAIQSFALAAELRKAGLNTMIYPEPVKLPKQFKFADKMKMKVALVLGPDEVEKGLVVVKNLMNGEQAQVSREALVESIKGILKMPEIHPVTKDNWRELIALQVRDDQKGFVASNVKSIAESQFGFDEPGHGHWDFYPFGIYEGETPVGFLMYGYNFGHPEQQAFIVRLMVAENFQGKGYGRFGMQKMLEIFHADARIQAVGISYEPENDVARKLYASLGFVEPGVVLGDEVLAVLKLRP